jgi:isoleucyl-tRNA synthetase
MFPDESALRSRLEPNAKAEWENLRALRAQVLQELERARERKFISASLEAKIRLRSNGPHLQFLRIRSTDLPSLFIVSQVEILPSDSHALGNDSGPVQMEVLRADGIKCERCWNYSTHVGENTRYPGICERCSEALAEIEGLELSRP